MYLVNSREEYSLPHLSSPGSIFLSEPDLLEALDHRHLALYPAAVLLHQQVAEGDALKLQLLPLVGRSLTFLLEKREREIKLSTDIRIKNCRLLHNNNQ